MKLLRQILVPAALLVPFAAFGLEVSAHSAIIMDATTGKVLWQKDADTQRYPASTTKIMTALLMLEHLDPSEIITAPVDIEKVKESSMSLKPYEQVPALDMMYAVMLRSANDGSHAAAVHIAGSVEKFAEMMNERARKAGATRTHFTNPHGLNDDRHVTTARDLALITRDAMKYKPFQEVARTPSFQIRRSVNTANSVMASRNRLLQRDPTLEGVKTGYTRPAGLCFVGAATRNGFRVITVVLKSDNWQEDTSKMLDWAYATYELKDAVTEGEVVQAASVKYGKQDTVGLVAAEGSTLLARVDGSDVSTEIVMDDLQAPVKRGEQIAEFVIRDTDGFEHRVPLLASDDVALSNIVVVARAATSRTSAVLFGSALFVGAYFVRTRRRIGDAT
jgi:serine-type D-Ala-D-Ala carboxypeptidase (penicillin-binding protein 5/6)